MFILKMWLLCRINFLHKDVPFLKLGDCTFQQAPKLCQTHAHSCPFIIHGGVQNSKQNANTYIVHIWRNECMEVWLYACTCSFWMVWTRHMWHLRHMGPIVHNLGPCVSQVSHCNGKTLLSNGGLLLSYYIHGFYDQFRGSWTRTWLKTFLYVHVYALKVHFNRFGWIQLPGPIVWGNEARDFNVQLSITFAH